MEVIENKDYIKGIKEEKIQILYDDYELKLEDLKYIKIKYDICEDRLIIEFKTIYLSDVGRLIKINFIAFYSYYYKFNAYYEKQKEKEIFKPLYEVTLSKELYDYFKKILMDIYNKSKDEMEKLKENRETREDVIILDKSEGMVWGV